MRTDRRARPSFLVGCRLGGRLALLRARAAERTYAPGGAGAEASRDEFEELMG